jgi:hypothetical protein
MEVVHIDRIDHRMKSKIVLARSLREKTSGFCEDDQNSAPYY